MTIEISNTYKDFTPPSQDIWLLVKQHKAHTTQKRKWVDSVTRFTFYYQGAINFVAKWMVEINPPSIEWLKSKCKAIEKIFGHHTIGDKKLSIIAGFTMKSFWSLQDWSWKAFSHCNICDGKLLIAIGLVTKNFWLPYLTGVTWVQIIFFLC